MIPALAVASDLCLDRFSILSFDAGIANSRSARYEHSMCRQWPILVSTMV